jgi:hypothetical protein
VRFSSAAQGLLKKAFELSLLYDAEVALIVFSPAGKLYEYASSRLIHHTPISQPLLGPQPVPRAAASLARYVL